MFGWLVRTVEDKVLQDFMDKAEELEREFDWLNAADFYHKALDSVSEQDFSKAAKIQERVGYCLYRGAFQAESQDEFKSRMLEAVKAYEWAAEVYKKAKHAKGLHCKAIALYAKSWTVVDAPRKEEVLDDCGRLLKEAMKAFEEAGDGLGYGKACNDLLLCLWDRGIVEWDWTENKRRLEEAIGHGQNVISTLLRVGDERELARAYVIVGLHSMRAGVGLLGEEKRKEFVQKALSYAEKALELSKKAGDEYLIAWSNWLAAATQFQLTGNLELSLRHAEDGLQQAKEMKDSFLIGWAFWGFAVIISWMMNAAEKEMAPEKKARYYEMAEKLLQASIGSYVKAKHPKKRDEVQRLLEKVREEREMAVTLSEVLHAPPIVSQTVAFATPTQTQEKAVGLERFENADIQANLILHVTELKVGENLEIEIELVNAGKAPALLIKVEQIVPKGFDLIEKPETYRVEDRYLNMKGRRLDPLKTEEVKLVLKPQQKGVFPLKPRVLYLDETGKYKSHEPEPVTITVKELGISGWLKGPGK